VSSIRITLKKVNDCWELISPSGLQLYTFREKYEHKALERAQAWASSWKDWCIVMEGYDEVRVSTEIIEEDELPEGDDRVPSTGEVDKPYTRKNYLHK